MQTIHKQLYERTKIIAVIDATAKVASTTAMIFFHIILHPAVLIYDFHVFITLYVNNFTRLTELKFLI